ncbi:uncharacterized protein LOC121986005 isoform X1 [Zingiber officinale]|uniref:Uncharacterized protein n=1 Tax=Zingiber officinale TaxID=94328 RepID=A0A8J5GSJ3_ZINOF|nr:uncharacterized protein LOC121986005 isoform X1 [Zingiber officinale]KAG6505322.1 hypothetical protein ZIOFF_037677 [Zingiber officinale]
MTRSAAAPALSLVYPSLASTPLPSKGKGLFRASSLPSPKPRTKRPNYLRLKTLIPNPQPLQTPPPPPLQTHEPWVVVLEEEVNAVEHVVQEVDAAEVVEDAPVATVGIDPAADLQVLPREAFGIALRFAALVAVQTMVAVWFLGGVGGEEGNGSGNRKVEEGRVGSAASQVAEFQKILEIRAMAKEARETERRELSEDSGVQGELSKKISSLRKRSPKVILDENGFSVSLPLPSKNVDEEMDGKKLKSKQNTDIKKLNYKRKGGFLKSIRKSENIPKGFGGSGKKQEPGKGSNGGVHQIAEEAAWHHEQANTHASEMAQSMHDIMDDVAVSGQEAVRQVSKGTNSTNDIAETFRKNKKSSKEITRISSLETAKVDKPRRNLHAERIDDRSFVNKDKQNQLNFLNNPWWLKLPYVLGILLRRGSNGRGPEGLYSLEANPSLGEESASYTIVFQDRGDAMNFCFLLESFFEDLGDVSADVVPLTIQELTEVLNLDALKLLVLRKGQIRLYAGLPLTEVETEIRSLLN